MKLPLCLFRSGPLDIPGDTGKWTDPKQRTLMADIRVKEDGMFRAFGMHLDSVGIWFGFQIDDHPFIVVHNAACVQAMGLIGAAGTGMPCWIPIMHGPKNLTLAYNKPFYFEHKLQLFMGNSYPTINHVSSIHLYFDADPSKVKFSGQLNHPTWVVEK